MLKLKCENLEVKLKIEEEERLSMLIVGKSRMGKTFFASLYGGFLCDEGYVVHLIDLGMKWTEMDKQKLRDKGATTCLLVSERVVLSFPSEAALVGSSRYLVDAFGLRSYLGLTSVRNIMKKNLVQKKCFSLTDIVEMLKVDADEDEGAAMVYERFGMFGEVPDIWFQVSEEKANLDANKNRIWDLMELDGIHMQMIAQLLLYWLLCVQRSKVKNKMETGKVFAIVDEFQNLNCSQKSIMGTCLTEGQKYGMNLILITQFLQGKFSEGIINQLKQGGFRVYFCLTEEEAMDVSRKLTKNSDERQRIYNRLINLPKGNCLFCGRHILGKNRESCEVPRFVKVVDETKK